MKHPAITQERACPACGSRAKKDLPHYSLDQWNVVSCQPCGFVYLHNVPELAALEAEFEWDASSAKETARRKKTMPILKRLDTLTRARLHLFPRTDDKIKTFFTKGAVLDVGCGTGHAFPPGPTPYGVEISPVLSKISRRTFQKLGGDVVTTDALSGVRQFQNDMFDGAIVRSFLEHEHQPGDLLNELARALKPGARLYIKVPNYGCLSRGVMGRKWCGFRWPDHVNYFTVKSLRQMLDQRGFDTRVINRANVWLEDNIHVLATRRAADAAGA